jgi:trk system potassium uptake protein TrkH
MDQDSEPELPSPGQSWFSPPPPKTPERGKGPRLTTRIIAWARERHLTIQQLLVVAFASTIILGALALMLSTAMMPGVSTLTPVDALFTATSAVCVTGLVVRDTATDFSISGQIIILFLIQAGGLGILTLSNALFLFGRRRIGLRNRMVMEETLGVLPAFSPRGVLARVFMYTFVCEGIGAALLTARFAFDYSFPRALWMGVFHAVSAFCNAGFAILQGNLTAYSGDIVVNVVIMALIILGGLGFIVVEDLWAWFMSPRRRNARVSLHSRIVLHTTFWLIVGGAIIIFLIELPGGAMPAPLMDRIMPSVFLSVTCRTAGFNTVDLSQLSNPTLLICILLMGIGGSPGSTAGGIKTTTFATLNALILSRARNRPKVELFNRSLPAEIVTKALATAAAAFLVVLIATIAIEMLEHAGNPHAEVQNSFLAILFEVVSALGTVGLSVGITPTLGAPAKVVLVICMFVGRLGTVLVANSLLGSIKRLEYTLPEEQIIVG